MIVTPLLPLVAVTVVVVVWPLTVTDALPAFSCTVGSFENTSRRSFLPFSSLTTLPVSLPDVYGLKLTLSDAFAQSLATQSPSQLNSTTIEVLKPRLSASSGLTSPGMKPFFQLFGTSTVYFVG